MRAMRTNAACFVGGGRPTRTGEGVGLPGRVCASCSLRPWTTCCKHDTWKAMRSIPNGASAIAPRAVTCKRRRRSGMASATAHLVSSVEMFGRFSCGGSIASLACPASGRTQSAECPLSGGARSQHEIPTATRQSTGQSTLRNTQSRDSGDGAGCSACFACTVTGLPLLPLRLGVGFFPVLQQVHDKRFTRCCGSWSHAQRRCAPW